MKTAKVALFRERKIKKTIHKDIVVHSEGQTIEQSVIKLVGDIRGLISSARGQIAQTVNVGTVTLYWSIGNRIRIELLHGKRAEYGEKIVSALWYQA